MKETIKTIIIIILIGVIIAMSTTKIEWEHNGQKYNHTLGEFFIERFTGE